MIDFEKLEKVNCQIDVWIDEEEYEKVFNAFSLDPLWEKELTKTFEDLTCTFNKDQEWLDLFITDSVLPVKKICIDETEIEFHDGNKDWAIFLGAKLIRARIQQKGTDCYFRRLDEIVAYLERHLPTICKEKEQTHENATRLAVIYLLEMAAAGEGADQRSFSERARRILRNFINQNDKDFINFYDLLARYNIGVGYFHEASYRKAVLEFNQIICKFSNSDKASDEAAQPIQEVQKFDRKNECFGKLLLYLPSILYRAEIQLKLQLAYHNLRTTSDFQKEFDEAYSYKRSKIALIRAEAYQQMENRDRSLDELRKAANYLLGRSKSSLMNGGQLHFQMLSDRLKDISFGQYINLRGRLIDLVIAGQLINIEKSRTIVALNDPESPYELFQLYRDYAKDKRSVRKGYLQQVAKFIKILVDLDHIELASKVYDNNRDGILEDEQTDKECPCEENGIDLRRLGAEHFEEFANCMKNFFKKSMNIYSQDSKRFFKRLHWLEENVRENLDWRKKELKSIYDDSVSSDWCSSCVDSFKSSSFDGLLACSGHQVTDGTKLNDTDYEWIMDHWDAHFLEHLEKASIHAPYKKSLHFLGLQRWNSTSPAQGRSLGGGYLIYHTDDRGMVDLGVAIDPGFDFVRNLFHVGFSLADIDVVLLSHAHLDHIRDFESMITLCLELYKRDSLKIRYKLHTIMTLGVYRRLEHIIENPGLRDFIEPYIIDIDKEINENYLNDKFIFKHNPSNKEEKKKGIKDRNRIVSSEKVLQKDEEGLCLTVRPTKAYHDDYSEYSDSFGFIINIIENKKNNSINQHQLKIGYTGDTKWYSDIICQYKECHSILVHLGSLIDRKTEKRKKFNYYSSSEKCFDFVNEENHPYLMGMLHFLTEMKEWGKKKKPLVLMSEYGEEMRGKIRLDLINRLKDAYGHDVDILPVDVGLDVLFNESDGGDFSPQVFCIQCKDYVKLDQVEFATYGHDEALFCVCKTCQKSTPQNVLQDNLRRLYEEGRPLQTLT